MRSARVEVSTARFRSVFDAVEAHARDAPQAIALADETGAALSWEELQSQLARIGEGCRSAGIDEKDVVATSLSDRLEDAVTLLGTMSVAIVAPQNPALTIEESRHALLASGARAVVTRPGSSAGIAAASLDLPLLQPELLAAAEGSLAYSMASRVAIVLPTTGTTGRPKLVALTIGNLAAGAAITAETLELDERDTCLNVMPLFHTHGLVGGLLSSFHAGAAVLFVGTLTDAAVEAGVRRWNPTWTTAAPSLHHVLLNVARKSPDLFRLRFLRSTSAPLPLALFRELERTYRAPVVQAYALTEAPGQITSNPLPPGERKPLTVGYAVGCDVRVVTPDGEATDGVGEILVRGPQVAGPYWDAEDLESPPDESWLRTGDLGEIDRDGYLTIAGRAKEMINRGGEKVAPVEVDEALQRHHLVRDAAAFGVEHHTLGEDVWAAVALEPGASIESGELRRFLAGHLSAFKIPARIVLVDEIPRTPTGKVRRHLLSEELRQEARR